MYLEEKIYFDNKPLPAFSEILAQLKSITGLNIEFENEYFFYEEMNEVEIRKDEESNAIVLGLYTINYFYLKVTLITAMLDLGGRYEEESKLPKWSRMKWSDKKWWQRIPS